KDPLSLAAASRFEGRALLSGRIQSQRTSTRLSLLSLRTSTKQELLLLCCCCYLLRYEFGPVLEHHRLVMSRRCFTGLTRVSLRRADGHLPLLARALTSQRSQTRRKHSSSGSNSSSSSNLDASKESTTTASTSTPTPSDDAQSTKKAADLSGLKHQVEHRATETIGIRLTERVVERIAEAAELGAEKTAASRTLAAVAKRAGRAATNTITPAAAAAPRGILGSLPVRTAVARVGRGFLIALPLAGAGFAAWIGRSDYRRTRQELELARARLALAEEKHNNSEVDV
ncbi:unnamed protein product, partial [Laminaria digitata]